MASPNHSRVRRVSGNVLERCGYLRQYVADLRNADIQYTETTEALAAVETLADDIQLQARVLAEAADSFQHEDTKLEAIQSLLIRYDQLLIQLHQYLAFFRDSHAYSLPNSLADYMRERTKHFLAIAVGRGADAEVLNAPLMLQANPDFNYYAFPMGRALAMGANSAGFKSTANPKMSVITFPRAEKDDTLNCVLLAHEAGHHIYQILDVASRFSTRAKGDGSLDAAKDLIAQAVMDADGKLVWDAADREKRLWGWVTDWLEELAADRIAVLLAGPAYVLAWVNMMLSVPEDQPDQEHPSPAKRFGELWTWLTDADSPWAPVAGSKLKEAAPWVDEIAAKGGLVTREVKPGAEYFIAVETAVATLLPHLHSVLDDLLGTKDELMEQFTDFSMHGEPTVALYKQGIPPGTVLTPSGYSASRETTILFCGWLVCLSSLDNATAFDVPADEDSPRFARFNRFNEHVAKALEGSMLFRIWKELDEPAVDV